MKIKQSVRKEASEEINKELVKSGLYPNGDGELIQNISPLRLSTTREELDLLLFEESAVRSGFSVDDTEVTVPVLFSKVNGNSDLLDKVKDIKSKNLCPIDMLSNFHLLKREAYSSRIIDEKIFVETGKLNKVYLYSFDEISYLNTQKKKMLINAIESIIEEKFDIDILVDVSDIDIVKSALFANERMYKLFHEANFNSVVPKLIISDLSKSTLNYQAVVRLLMYHYLCMDVIIFSKKSYSSIEDYLPREYYDVFNI